MEIGQIRECPDCASANIVRNETREQIICRDCGLIFEPLAPQLEKAFERTHKTAKPKTKAKASKRAKPKKRKKR